MYSRICQVLLFIASVSASVFRKRQSDRERIRMPQRGAREVLAPFQTSRCQCSRLQLYSENNLLEAFPAHVHCVPSQNLKLQIFPEQFWVVLRSNLAVIFAPHDAEHAGQAFVAQTVGKVEFLTGLFDDRENLFQLQIVYRQKLVPLASCCPVTGNGREYRALGSTGRLLRSDAQAVDDNLEPHEHRRNAALRVQSGLA